MMKAKCPWHEHLMKMYGLVIKETEMVGQRSQAQRMRQAWKIRVATGSGHEVVKGITKLGDIIEIASSVS